jgi:hypothetical protein
VINLGHALFTPKTQFYSALHVKLPTVVPTQGIGSETQVSNMSLIHPIDESDMLLSRTRFRQEWAPERHGGLRSQGNLDEMLSRKM